MKTPIAAVLNIPSEPGYIVVREKGKAEMIHSVLVYTPPSDRWMICESIRRVDTIGGPSFSAHDDVDRMADHPIFSHNKRGPRRKNLDGLIFLFVPYDTDLGTKVSFWAHDIARQRQAANGGALL